VNVALALVALVALVLAGWWPVAAVFTAVAVVVGPVGLSVRGRSSSLNWTRRLRTLASFCAISVLLFVVAFAALRTAAGAGVLDSIAEAFAIAAFGAPLLVDLSLALTTPLERRMLRPYVERAAARLARENPTVVAITGSFGKTSTKGYIAHILSTKYNVVASPASYNNRAGLARTINEHLSEGTDVFVAEMGTYSRGEIAELCSWIPPDIAVITGIGPVHLERFRSEERIAQAKSEILVGARCVVLEVDDERLAELARESERHGKTVWRCSTVDKAADVFATDDSSGDVTVLAKGHELAIGVAQGARPGNVACATAVALELGLGAHEIANRLASLPSVAHRLEPSLAASGVMVLDDTYNSNPAGAEAALRRLQAARAEVQAATAEVKASPAEGRGATPESHGARRTVVVTPGMVELGRLQRNENARFGAQAASIATDLLIVGRTNRKALLEGVSVARSRVSDEVPGGGVEVHTFDNRDQAVEWVRRNLGPGEVVLYENDLPDHYP
ncbi:MAG TPA: UDP-N-acetylmuramoyl-tripeptide--D-alanyl-D-alanine ligase, partial [Acidimicrobiales bacterium]|nr:UDP-N-acetylmuramoyl-tripeptide--D-alanyl-D-alanine ligase [Acidimicrobiales bacterium]